MDILDNAWKAATERVDEIGRAREQLTNGIGDRASQMTRDAMQQIGDISQSVEKRLQQFQQPKQSTHERPTTRERVMKMMEGIDNEHRLSRSSSYSSIDSQASTVRSSSRSQSPALSGDGLSQFSSSPSIASQASTVRSPSRTPSPAPSRAPSQRSTTSRAPDHGSTTSRVSSQGPNAQSMFSKAGSTLGELYKNYKPHRASEEKARQYGGKASEITGGSALALDGFRAAKQLIQNAPKAAAQAAESMYDAGKGLKEAAKSAREATKEMQIPDVSSTARHAASSAARGAKSAVQGINPENAREAARAAGIVGGAAARGAAYAAGSAYRGARGAASNMTSANAGNAARAAREVGKSLAQSGVSAAKSAASAMKSAFSEVRNYRTDGLFR